MSKPCPPPSTSESPQADSASREEQARALCLRLLTARARTRAELAGQLTKRGYPDDVSALVLDRLAAVGLVDDEDFAEQWVRSRRVNAGKGRRALASELRTKGIDDDVIAAALEDIDSDAERSRAEQLVADKLRRERLTDDADDVKVDAQAGRHAGPPWLRPIDGLRRGQGRVGQRAGAPPGLAVEVGRQAHGPPLLLVAGGTCQLRGDVLEALVPN